MQQCSTVSATRAAQEHTKRSAVYDATNHPLVVEVMSARIPLGKHKGKLLSELTLNQLGSLRGGWKDSQKLRQMPFFVNICCECQARGMKPLKSSDLALLVDLQEATILNQPACFQQTSWFDFMS